MKDWQDRAARGDDWAHDRLLSRPVLSSEAESYWQSFTYLSRDRAYLALSLGIAGGLQLPQPIPRGSIRKEGNRRGYQGESLEDFTEIVAAIDDAFIQNDVLKQAAAAKAGAERARSRR
ncbi:MAG: hypothetical protein K2Y40_13620 [Reyranella sp.]|nr:hypothetical protein [Reyranella sp.]